MEDERQRQDKTRKELPLIAHKAVKGYKEYVKNYNCVIIEIHSLTKDQQHFFMDLLPLSLPISRVI